MHEAAKRRNFLHLYQSEFCSVQTWSCHLWDLLLVVTPDTCLQRVCGRFDLHSLVGFVSWSLESSHISLDVLSSHPTLCFLSEMRWWGVILDSEAVSSIITGKRHRIKQQSYAFSLHLQLLLLSSSPYYPPLSVAWLPSSLSLSGVTTFVSIFHIIVKAYFEKYSKELYLSWFFTFYTAFFKIFLVREALIFVNISFLNTIISLK